MAKVAIIADVHIGNHKVLAGEALYRGMNTRCVAVLECLQAAVTAAIQRGSTELLVLGDLFDTDKPTPPMVALTMSVLQRFVDAGGRVHLLLGNHEASSVEPQHNALAPFRQLPGIVSYDSFANVVEGVGVLLPFFRKLSPYGQVSGWGTEPLFGHFGVWTESEPQPDWVKDSYSAACAEALFRSNLAPGQKLFVGDWHQYRKFEGPDGREIYQVGALVPTGFDNPGMEGYGSVLFFDTDTGKVVREEIPGPRFVTVRSVEELSQYIPEPEGIELYVRWLTSLDQVKAAEVYLASIPKLGGYEVVVDKRVSEAAAKSAATTAASQETLFDAAVEYMARVELPAGVRRERVFEIVRTALKL